ncbi:MAG: Rrf2 family transcriptional regulator [Kiritimatiellae bacterium]|nr:Rrf2 family transcriptional regulator [Kiritimatiellia bacterium]MDD4175248.1 Rrf2 family transcriptional regulator [Kiritimatiellia bacterium]MDD4442297.1 Rrf2 family transcriptional regulator [Kiritimatiellia bacterium]HQL49700.1 Rrf2 family transcriptional regulator [Kiritimatiellia bacterium]
MRISTKGRYGLRTLMDIALHQSQGAVTLNDIAKRQRISVKYLWQVINPLKTAGFLSVTRGAKGGYVLARRPDEIDLFEIVTILEGEVSLVDCLHKNETCEMRDACVARSVWMDVNRVVEKALKKVKLSDVLKRCEGASDVNNYVI